MGNRWKSGRRRWRTSWVTWVLLGGCALIFGLTCYRYLAFNLWLDRDARVLQPYPVVLIEEGKPVSRPDETNPEALDIDRALIESNAANRLVVHLSRSELRSGWPRQRVYTKVFLKTSMPGEPGKVQRIKFLNVLTRTDGHWQVMPDGVVQLTLP